ncbi:MAG: tetratricopeptide repeat protein [Betaproteobacteria bacterium]|nr:tetratricopeptide repeat protein [Betaproteobacteria bacterium]
MSTNPWWHHQRARLALFFNRRDSAMAALRDVLAVAPDDTLALCSLGFLHGDKGEYVMAERYFREAVQRKPDDANTLFNLGFILQKQNHHEQAIATFDAALAINKTIDRAWFGKGMSLAALKRHHEAIPSFERAAKLQPMNPHALYELGLQHHVLGQREKVDETVARLKEFDPKATEQLLRATQKDTASGAVDARG